MLWNLCWKNLLKETLPIWILTSNNESESNEDTFNFAEGKSRFGL